MSWAHRAWLGVLGVVVLLGGGLLVEARADDRTAVAPCLYAVGHSWVVGTSSGEQIGYVHELAARVGAQVVDADHTGFRAPQVRRLVDGAPRCRPSDLAVVQVGLNDVRLRGESGLRPFRRALRGILARLDGCDVVVVREPGALDYRRSVGRVLGSTHVLDDYRRVTADLVLTRPRTTMVTPVLAPGQYLVDGLHPNLSGNRTIARAISRSAAWRAFARRVKG